VVRLLGRRHPETEGRGQLRALADEHRDDVLDRRDAGPTGEFVGLGEYAGGDEVLPGFAVLRGGHVGEVADIPSWLEP
jgi:hypothetical protein